MINMSENQIVNVAISGGMGKMGQLVSSFIETKDGFNISGIYDPAQNSEKYHNFDSLEEISGDLLIEFSPSDQINSNLSQLMNSSMNLIVGSSGIEQDTIEELKNTISKDQFICVIPNFSIGASLQKIFSKLANDSFENVTIEERHHNNKKDAPSGTAINLANELKSQTSDTDNSKQSKTHETNLINDINITSIRDEKYIAEQTVFLHNQNESMSIDHIVNDRSAYIEGINYILDAHNDLKGFIHGLENIMIERFKI